MAGAKITTEIKEKAIAIIAGFNGKVFKGKIGYEYYAIFRGRYLYLNLKEGDRDGPVARLGYTGNFSDWDFAIFKWSVEQYDPYEDNFPGFQYIDGTIQGALEACYKAYPPNYSASTKDFLNFLRRFSKE